MSEAKYAGNGKIVCPECHGRKTVKCEKCNGHGEFSTCNNCHDTGKVDCPSCGGSGKETSICPVCNEGKVVKSHWTTCHKCNGTGRRIWADGVERTWSCPHCDGHGQVHEKYKEFCPNCHGEYKRKTDNPCKKCDGTGKIRCSRCDGSSHAKCQDCGGRGKVKCGKCGGKGYVAVDDATSVKLMQAAANEGNLQALHDLAIAYAVGQYGLPIDCGKAQEFFKSILNHEDDEEFDYFADSVEGHIKYLPAVCKGDTDAMRELAKWFSEDALEERGLDCTPRIEGREPEKFWLEKASEAEKAAKTEEETKCRNEENRRSCKANAALRRAEKSMSFLATVLLLTTAAFFAWWWIDGANVSAFNGIGEAMRPANGNESGIVAGMSLAILGNILLAVLLLPWALLNFFLGRKSERASFKSSRRRWIFKWLGALFGFIGIHLAYARRWGLFFLLLIGLFMWGGGNDKKHPQAATSEVNGEPTSTQIAKPFREREPQETQSNGGEETSLKLQGQDEKKPTEEKDDGILTSTNIGFAVWLLLWFGGTLFIKEDGSKLEM